MKSRLIVFFLCVLVFSALSGCKNSGGSDELPSIPQNTPDITPSETVSVPQNTPNVIPGNTNEAPPKINVYSVYEENGAEGFVINFDILGTIIVDETSVAPVIECILLEKIFKIEIVNNQFGPISPINGVNYEDGVLTIDYSTVGGHYLNRGSYASTFIRREIARTVFSCSLINTLDERLDGKSETYVNHYSFLRVERIEEYDVFIEEEASIYSASVILDDKNYAVFFPISVSTENLRLFADALGEFLHDKEERSAAIMIDLDGNGIVELIAYTGTDNSGYADPEDPEKWADAIGNTARITIYGIENDHILSFDIDVNLSLTTDYCLYITDKNYLVLLEMGHESLETKIYKYENGEIQQAVIGGAQSHSWVVDFDGSSYYNEDPYDEEFGAFFSSMALEFGLDDVAIMIKNPSLYYSTLYQLRDDTRIILAMAQTAP